MGNIAMIEGVKNPSNLSKMKSVSKIVHQVSL
jgi:hypothetical protein